MGPPHYCTGAVRKTFHRLEPSNSSSQQGLWPVSASQRRGVAMRERRHQKNRACCCCGATCTNTQLPLSLLQSKPLITARIRQQSEWPNSNFRSISGGGKGLDHSNLRTFIPLFLNCACFLSSTKQQARKRRVSSRDSRKRRRRNPLQRRRSLITALLRSTRIPARKLVSA